MKPCLLFLSCKNIDEADKISLHLLKEGLIVCAKKIPIVSNYLWNNKIESTQEILLIMDSIEESFKKVDEEVKKLHSYKTYNLVMVKIDNINDRAFKWLQYNLLPSK